MITSLRLVDLKNFADETLRIGPFTVIVGANASATPFVSSTASPAGTRSRRLSAESLMPEGKSNGSRSA